MSSTKIEFAVQMTCGSCVAAVKKSLENVPGINDVVVDLEKNSVIVDSSLSTLEVQKKLEESGRKVAVRGFGGSVAGVSILESGEKDAKGVVRFIQATERAYIIDGTVDGLLPGGYEVSIHECGDISQGCQSVGDVYSPNNVDHPDYGKIGTVTAGQDGRATFRLENNVIKLSDIIGRSFVISQVSKEPKRVACGVVARSSGLFENPKTICACDGVTIWSEKIPPKSTL